MQDYAVKINGDQYTANEFNGHIEELENFIKNTGITLDGNDLNQLQRAAFVFLNTYGKFNDNSIVANSYVLTPIRSFKLPDQYAVFDGVVVEFYANAANDSTTVLIDIGETTGTTLGARPLKDRSGSDPVAGAVRGLMKIQYDSLNNYWTIYDGEDIVPNIGELHIQFPGEDDPDVIFSETTWQNVSSTWAGNFFRVEGGNASAFESGTQLSQNKEHTHQIQCTTGVFSGTAYLEVPGGQSNDDPSKFQHPTLTEGGIEAWPNNETMRIWRRVA